MATPTASSERATSLKEVREREGGAQVEMAIHGLAEKRPSVMVGDEVRMSLAGESQRTWRGRATHVCQEVVTLSVSADFAKAYTVGAKVEVRFVLTRTSLQLFHEGVAQVSLGSEAHPQPITAHQPLIDG